ncbi:MAG: MFS transporter [Bacteroidetes bacterium]|nr:MFS transporter [Bacteroidota bacterium]
MTEGKPVKARLWTRNFILLSFANFLMFTAFYFLVPILPIYVVEVLKGKNSLVGLILASYTLAALIIRPFTGVTIDALGRRLIFLVSFIIFTLLFNLYIVATSVALLLALRFMHGFAWGVTSTAGNTLIVDMVPPSRRGEGIGIFGLSFTLAMAVGPLLGMLILNQNHYSLLFFSGFLLSLAGWILATQARYPGYVPLNGGKVKLKGLLEKKAVPVSLNLLTLNITYGGLISFITLYGKEIGIKNPGLFFFLYAIGVSVSRSSAGRIFDKKGPATLVGVGNVIVATGFILLASWKSVPGYFIAALLLGFGGGVIMPTFQAMVNNMIEPYRRGAANSTMFTALDLGIGLGMVTIGFLSQWTNLTIAFLCCSLLCILSLIYFFTLVLPHYKKCKIAGV